jgi:hypothetical protein
MFVNELFESDTAMNTLVIYPGRFQPWHKGHKAVYDYLVKNYGRDNVFIATSNKVDPPRSPFTFSEKVQFMNLTGVSSDRIIETRDPYKALEVVQNYDPTTTRLIFAVSEKDMSEDPRFSFKTKKDGSPSYFQPMPKQTSNMVPLQQHGYIMTVPTFNFTVLGQPMRSATEVRAQFAEADEETQRQIVKDLFGSYDKNVHDIMRQGLNEATDPKFVGFMNKALGNKVDPAKPTTNMPAEYSKFEIMSFDNMPGYRPAFKFGMSVLQTMDPTTRQHFVNAPDDDLFVYMLNIADKKGFMPKYFVEEDLDEVTQWFDEIFHDPTLQSWTDLLKSMLGKPGVAEGEVIPFKQPSKTLTWQQVPRDILLLANDWFWASEDNSGLAATIDPDGFGNGTANDMKYNAAKLQQKGWTIDFNDEYDPPRGPFHLRLTNKRGQTVLLPIEDAQSFTGWAKGTSQYDLDEGEVKPFVIPADQTQGNYENMGYRKNSTDKFALIDHTFNKVILTTNDSKLAKREAIEWAEYDDIVVSVRNQQTNKIVFKVNGYADAEKYLDENSLKEFAPTVPTGPKGPKDYGQPNSSRYLGGYKFVLGTTHNYILTAEVQKYGLEWDEDDEIWYLDSPGAVYIADATEGEIELPPAREQRYQIHDLVTDYLNARNSADLQRVAAYFGHSADGEMSEALDEIVNMPPVTKRMDIQSMYNDMQTKIKYHEASQLTPINFPMTNQIFRDDKYGLKFFLLDKENNPVFYLGVSKFHDGYKTGVVAGNKEVQGQGLGWKLYKAVSDYLNVPLYSDSTQTADSKSAIWQRLINNYPKQVVGYDQISRKNVPVNNIYQTLPQDQLKYVDDDTRRNTLLLKLLPSSIAKENLDESFGVGPLQIGDVWFDIRKHALDRLAERKVPISTAKEMLRRISMIKNKIQQIGVGQPIWIHDSTLGISMGMRVLDSGKIQWATVIIGAPKNRDAETPIIDLNERRI